MSLAPGSARDPLPWEPPKPPKRRRSAEGGVVRVSPGVDDGDCPMGRPSEFRACWNTNGRSGPHTALAAAAADGSASFAPADVAAAGVAVADVAAAAGAEVGRAR